MRNKILLIICPIIITCIGIALIFMLSSDKEVAIPESSDTLININNDGFTLRLPSSPDIYTPSTEIDATAIHVAPVILIEGYEKSDGFAYYLSQYPEEDNYIALAYTALCKALSVDNVATSYTENAASWDIVEGYLRYDVEVVNGPLVSIFVSRNTSNCYIIMSD